MPHLNDFTLLRVIQATHDIEIVVPHNPLTNLTLVVNDTDEYAAVFAAEVRARIGGYFVNPWRCLRFFWVRYGDDVVFGCSLSELLTENDGRLDLVPVGAALDRKSVV